MPLLVGRAASLAALEAASGSDRLVLLVAQRDPETQEPAAADLYRVGVVARVRQLSRLGTGTVKVLVEGVTRARVSRYVPAANACAPSSSPCRHSRSAQTTTPRRTCAARSRCSRSTSPFIGGFRRSSSR